MEFGLASLTGQTSLTIHARVNYILATGPAVN